jgi:hypothetical protein
MSAGSIPDSPIADMGLSLHPLLGSIPDMGLSLHPLLGSIPDSPIADSLRSIARAPNRQPLITDSPS